MGRQLLELFKTHREYMLTARFYECDVSFSLGELADELEAKPAASRLDRVAALFERHALHCLESGADLETAWREMARIVDFVDKKKGQHES